MPRTTPAPPCRVCPSPSVAKMLCDKHYRRWKKYGNPVATKRPSDWGKREKQPLYNVWRHMARTTEGRDSRWKDYIIFAVDVGLRPSERHILRRHDVRKPWGPENFYWHKKGAGLNLKKGADKAAYARAWRHKNKLKDKGYKLKMSYGISLEDYHDRLEFQAGVCAICLKAPSPHKMLSVDHCHESGKIRGLLCDHCNRALGSFGDDPERFRRALIYLTGSITGT
jgi:hypothetical protein